MSHYLLNDVRAYQAWREEKLNIYPRHINELIIDLNNPIKLMDKEINSIIDLCSRANMVIYRCDQDHDARESSLELARQLGLNQLDDNICSDEDRISVIQDEGNTQSHYIPYTNKALNWHTDGYYNNEQQRIHAFLMHCVKPAKQGGENSYLDPEIAYILLRDENPEYIAALMQDDVMTIPANELDKRQAQSGPVFYLDALENLCMRYTARTRSIIWKKDKQVESALACLSEILQSNEYILSYRLHASEGVICNNVLHKRTAFEDDESKRLLYRGRFYNRIKNNAQEMVSHSCCG